MKLIVLSDLHLELRDPRWIHSLLDGADRDADGVVLAGDITRAGAPLDAVLAECHARYPLVLFVPGNHEYYGHGAALADLWMGEALRPGMVVEREGRRFLGGTMWFPPTPDEAEHRPLIADFEQIAEFVPWVHERNREMRAFLEAELRAGDIVITHHLPSPESSPARYRKDPVNRFFVSDMSDLIRRRSPSLWIHGHTHAPCDYLLGVTHVVCNPAGYPGESTRPYAAKSIRI